jgi:hypothetical protein
VSCFAVLEEEQGEFMGRMRVTFWPVVGIVGFIALVLCGLGLAAVAVIFRSRS